MRFVPLDGTGVLMSAWKTRIRDFAAFVAATGYDATAGMTTLQSGDTALRGANWRAPGFPQTPEHPVVGVSWKDAYAFCDWLTQREHETGSLDEDQLYRLPTDAEWSRAVGLPDEPGETPQGRSGKIRKVYPWGKQWPPPGTGNFADPQGGKHARKRTTPTGEPYTQTAPVGCFAANAFGLYDMAGNVRQWCSDNYKSGGALRHWGVLRGGSWADYGPSILQTSYRNAVPATERDVIYGFRCVIESGL